MRPSINWHYACLSSEHQSVPPASPRDLQPHSGTVARHEFPGEIVIALIIFGVNQPMRVLSAWGLPRCSLAAVSQSCEERPLWRRQSFSLDVLSSAIAGAPPALPPGATGTFQLGTA
jgi:hypothetical protein